VVAAEPTRRFLRPAACAAERDGGHGARVEASATSVVPKGPRALLLSWPASRAIARVGQDALGTFVIREKIVYNGLLWCMPLGDESASCSSAAHQEQVCESLNQALRAFARAETYASASLEGHLLLSLWNSCATRVLVVSPLSLT
jgi:hypothetical protein